MSTLIVLSILLTISFVAMVGASLPMLGGIIDRRSRR